MSEQDMERINLSPGEKMFVKIGEAEEKYLQEVIEFGDVELSAAGATDSVQNAKKVKTEQSEITENRGKQEKRKAQRAQNRQNGRKKHRGRIVAVTVLAAAVAVLLLVFGGKRMPLKLSDEKVRVRNMTVPPVTFYSSSLIELTEEEIFFGWRDIGETTIVRGMVTDIQNIVIDFNGDSAYRALVYVEVEKVLRGECQPEDVVTVLIPCTISEGFWVEDTDVISQVRVSMEGIFMLNQYDEESIWMQNGVNLYPIDIAQYGLLDGERFAFLQTDGGLVYSKWPYESFEGFGEPQTLDDVEEYIRGVIEKQ